MKYATIGVIAIALVFVSCSKDESSAPSCTDALVGTLDLVTATSNQIPFDINLQMSFTRGSNKNKFSVIDLDYGNRTDGTWTTNGSTITLISPSDPFLHYSIWNFNCTDEIWTNTQLVDGGVYDIYLSFIER